MPAPEHDGFLRCFGCEWHNSKMSEEIAAHGFVFGILPADHYFDPGNDANAALLIARQFLRRRREAIKKIEQDVAIDERLQRLSARAPFIA